MIISNVEQRSAEWFRVRLGNFTGSRIADLMGSARGKADEFSQTAMTYIYQVAGERMLNPAFVNDDDTLMDYINLTNVTTKAMQWGVEQEAEAKNVLLTLHPEWEMAEVSSCKHDEVDNLAASPDAIVYDRQKLMTIEIKCPNVNTHVKYMHNIKDGQTLLKTEPKYYWQVMAEMACTGAECGLFVSYNPWLLHPIHVVKIERDEDAISKMIERVKKANELIEDIIR